MNGADRVRSELPPYFKAKTKKDGPWLQDDYTPGGHNHTKAEDMLNRSILPFCQGCPSSCDFRMSTRFQVRKFQRLENVALFKRHKSYERDVAQCLTSSRSAYFAPTWLQKLASKNDLSSAANCVYLFHGTDAANLESIVRQGLKTEFSLRSRGTQTYGKGLYFTDNACKASQYARNGDSLGNVILVCRVVLGSAEILSAPCPNRRQLSHGKKGLYRRS
jgi:hypothetical protein